MNTSPQEILERLSREKDVVEQAKLIQYLYKEQYYSLREIAHHLKKHPSHISHLLRLLKLPELVLDGYYSKTISMAHLILLSRLESEEETIDAYKKILEGTLSSAQTDDLIREIKFDVTKKGEMISKEEIKTLKESFNNLYPDTHIDIIQSRVKAKIKIEIEGDSDHTTQVIRSLLEILAPAPEEVDELKVLE